MNEKKIQKENEYVGGFVKILSGKYANALIELCKDESLVIGRDPNASNLVLSASWISRKHCTVSYNWEKTQYQVTDYSNNGTYLSSGERLQAEKIYELSPGTVITIGVSGIDILLM